MNIRQSKLLLSVSFSAVAMVVASVAGAAENGLSHNEQAAQHAIVDASANSSAATTHDGRFGTLAQNESAAQRVIVVDYSTVSTPIAVNGEAAALVVNERAAQRAIIDAPRAHLAMTKDVATTPVAVR